ncbi:MAG: hypothetical protein K6E78_09290 [Treponema sp.]|nr:hypothetical protein [Treponema sp.]
MEIIAGNQIELMKSQLRDMMENPQRYKAALKSGYICAGFGGDLNGIHVPETLMTGRLPAGVSPEEALQEVIQYMKQVIAQAEAQQKEKIVSTSPASSSPAAIGTIGTREQ